MPTSLRLLSCALGALLIVAAPAAAASDAGTPVAYDPPIDAPVSDPFRAPVSRYAAGNRGIDYATDEGQVVRAAADGVVSFAGRVGHGLHVVIAHADGVRTSYSFLAGIDVRRGARVRRGDPIATTATALHFGARIGDAYVDPRDLFGGGRDLHAQLVDDDGAADGATTGDAAGERRALLDHLRRLAPHPTPSEIDDWDRAQIDCTPAAAAQRPLPPIERRIAVLVGGLGSSTGHAAILDVDTDALGYQPADVHQFSYRSDGGAYGARDTQLDIHSSARLLAEMVERIAAAEPGVPIDVIAHSQGGLVARAAIAAAPAAFDDVATLVTLGTPHRGNVLADAGTRLTYGVRVAGIDPSSASVGQLAHGSAFIAELDAAPPPPSHIVVRSIAASTDAIVPVGATRWRDADSVVVDLAGRPTAVDHARLPGDPASTTEIALAIRRRPPTCVDYGDWRRRQQDGALIGGAQEGVATGVTWASERLSAGGGVVVRR